MGTWNGIQIGATGLGAQRRGVETAGQNIANVNTPGYTRQRVSIIPDAGPVTPAIHSTWDGGGLGVRGVEYERLRDVFLDRRLREESALQSQLQATTDAYQAIERIFNEPSDSGLASSIADYFAAWDDVANRPDDIAARAQLVERGRTLTTDLNQSLASLQELADLDTSRIYSLVSEVNGDAAQIAAIQDTIQAAEAAGLNANELKDQRDALMQGLAEKIGGTVRYEDDGTASFFVGGVALVRGSYSYEIEAIDDAGTTRIVWPNDGREVGVGGEAAGRLENVNSLIPGYIADLTAVGTQLLNDVNAVHATGFDRNGNPGIDFFQYGPNGFEVNPLVLDDPNLVAAAATPGTYDGSIALQLAGMTGVDDNYRELVVRLGVSSQSFQRRQSLQNAVVEQVSFEQEAANGVNLDEELSDLVRFQRAYEANSRFISAVDDLLNTLVNGTGRVGR